MPPILSPSAEPPLYLAFADGAISYDCAPCGRCCRGLGIADDLVHLKGSPDISKLGPFIASPAVAEPLVSFFTYADGCRYLADDNACGLHRASGAQAKPRICRLFPFSKILDVDGLWVVMPHHRCPWSAASGKTADVLSEHASILADLDSTLRAQLTPATMEVRTSLPAAQRQAVEEQIRDALTLSMAPSKALSVAADAQGASVPELLPLPHDSTLWYDLLRCAGAPPALSKASKRLFVATLPVIRVTLMEHLPYAAIPVACAGFELWLRTLAELADGHFTGEDLLTLLQGAVPILRILAFAEQAIPEFDPSQAPQDLVPLIGVLQSRAGEPLGPVLLDCLRHQEHGALTALTRLGSLF